MSESTTAPESATPEPILPFWFKQRQGKAAKVSDSPVMYEVTAPNQQDAFVLIEKEDDHWMAAVRETADGENLDATPAMHPNPWVAWEAAFELYRQHIIV